MTTGLAPARCPHPSPEPVTTVDGVHVGYLCPDCDTALAADWKPNWQRNFFINSAGSGVLGGMAAYWVDEAAELTPRPNPYFADAPELCEHCTTRVAVYHSTSGWLCAECDVQLERKGKIDA